MATNDDEYDGYYIPKGTIVLGGSWLVRRMTTAFCPDFPFLGPYCMTLRFSTIRWNTNLNGI